MSGSDPVGGGRTPKRIGVLGGTFDPVHNGHIAVASLALTALDLDEVVFVPAADPYLRSSPRALIGHRCEMVRLVTEDYARFLLSTVDAVRTGRTYTLDTLTDLKSEKDTELELVLLLGADSAHSFDQWKNPTAILELASLAVFSRPGEMDPASLPHDHPARTAVYVDELDVQISATEIRERLRDGKSAADLLPEKVIGYICQNGLYRE